MKTCPYCDGTLWRHGSAAWHKGLRVEGIRYKCSFCQKTVTVRENAIQDPTPGRWVKDWRNEVDASNHQRTEAVARNFLR